VTWTYTYDEGADETTITWESGGGAVSTTIDGKITRWKNGYPDTVDAREAVAEMVQSAGTPDRIRMQYDFNYGFSERDSEQS